MHVYILIQTQFIPLIFPVYHKINPISGYRTNRVVYRMKCNLFIIFSRKMTKKADSKESANIAYIELWLGKMDCKEQLLTKIFFHPYQHFTRFSVAPIAVWYCSQLFFLPDYISIFIKLIRVPIGLRYFPPFKFEYRSASQ